MAKSYRQLSFLLVLLLGCSAALSCNSMLGIDEAELDPARVSNNSSTGGQTSMTVTPATYVPTTNCTTPLATCKACMETCPSPGAFTDCLNQKDCRDELDVHRVRLGANCLADDPETWASSAEEILSPDLGSCAATTCRDECAGAPLAAMCDLLCACKMQFCSEPDLNTCLMNCSTLEPEVAYCRFKHCQIADDPVNNPLHCAHANGNNACVTAAIPRNTCVSLVHSGFGCNIDDECCSNNCNSGVCE